MLSKIVEVLHDYVYIGVGGIFATFFHQQEGGFLIDIK